MDEKTGEHKPMDESGKGLNGTARYASINAHQGRTQSRRDDIESLGYMLLYLARGSVPWQGLQNSDKKNEDIMKVKIETPVEDLCSCFPAAEALSAHINYARGLAYDTKPDYNFLRGLYEETLSRYGVEDDGVWDWNYKGDAVQIMAGDESQWRPMAGGGVGVGSEQGKGEKGGSCQCVVS